MVGLIPLSLRKSATSLDPMSDSPFTVIKGQRDERTVVCTWCGETFFDRDGLEAHWLTDPRCKANRNVSSPLRPDAVPFGVRIVPGADTLDRVRAMEDQEDE